MVVSEDGGPLKSVGDDLVDGGMYPGGEPIVGGRYPGDDLIIGLSKTLGGPDVLTASVDDADTRSSTRATGSSRIIAVQARDFDEAGGRKCVRTRHAVEYLALIRRRFPDVNGRLSYRSNCASRGGGERGPINAQSAQSS